jgi:spermidine synthase
VELLKNLKSEFRYVKNYIASVPTYPAIWSFTYASDSLELDVPPKRKISPTKYYHPNMGLDTTKEIVDEVFGCS